MNKRFISMFIIIILSILTVSILFTGCKKGGRPSNLPTYKPSINSPPSRASSISGSSASGASSSASNSSISSASRSVPSYLGSRPSQP